MSRDVQNDETKDEFKVIAHFLSGVLWKVIKYLLLEQPQFKENSHAIPIRSLLSRELLVVFDSLIQWKVFW